MALPDGVQTKTVTIGAYKDILGVPAKSGTVWITASTDLYHAASGEGLLYGRTPVALDFEAEGWIVLPVVDQSGFTNEAGDSVTLWTYTAERVIQLVDGTTRTLPAKTFQVLAADADPIDLEAKIGIPSSGGVVVSTGVSSVAGLTGNVSASGLAAALTTLAPKASPALTGTPTAPTATAGTNTTQVATTAFVAAAAAGGTIADATTTTAGKVRLAVDLNDTGTLDVPTAAQVKAGIAAAGAGVGIDCVNAGDTAPAAGTYQTAHLQSYIDLAVTKGHKRVVIPARVPSETTLPWDSATTAWVIDTELVCPANVHIDARNAKIKKVGLDTPAFWIAPHVDHVTINVGYCYNTEPASARAVIGDYPTGTIHGANALAASAGISSNGAWGHFTGRFSGFRYGVRLSNWSGTGTATDGARASNFVDIEVDRVDFGLVFSAQSNIECHARGSYVATVGSTDPPHLIYPADSSTASSGTGSGEAWDSTDGNAYNLKALSNFHWTSLVARNCPGVVQVFNPLGPISFGEIVGYALTADSGIFTGGIEGVRGDTNLGLSSNKHAGMVRLDYSTAATKPRAMSLNNDWTIDNIKITYNTATTATDQALIHVFGNNVTLGQIEITNLGAGGLNGLRLAGTTSGCTVTASPVMRGVSNGIVIDGSYTLGVYTGVTGYNLHVDEGTIDTIDRDTYFEVSYVPANVGSIWPFADKIFRENYWQPFFTSSAALVSFTPTLSRMYLLPWTNTTRKQIKAFCINNVALVSGGFVRVGLYNDGGNGVPLNLLVDGGAIDQNTATGAISLDLTAMLDLYRAGVYVAVVQQGVTAQVRGFPTNTITVTSSTAAGAVATNGGVIYVDGVTGALPATVTPALSTATTNVPIVGYQVNPRI